MIWLSEECVWCWRTLTREVHRGVRVMTAQSDYIPTGCCTHGFIDASGKGTGNTSLICGVIFWRELVEGKNSTQMFLSGTESRNECVNILAADAAGFDEVIETHEP